MDTLPDIGRGPEYGLNASGTFARDVANFGDGYELRQPSGLQSFRREWTFSWNGLGLTQRDTLRDFLNARRGVEAFICPIPGEGNVRVICEDPPSSSQYAFNLYTLSATFKEDLNP